MMFDVVTGGTGTRARIPGVEVFGKTGTSNEFIDAWFIGGIPGLTTAVYAGNDNHKTLGRNQTGGIVAAPAWKTFMEFAASHLNVPRKFDPPPAWVEVESVSICRVTGFRARSGCAAVRLYMPLGRAPTAECPLHGGSYELAREDPNAPRLYLLDQDDDFVSATIPGDAEPQQPLAPPPPPPPVDPVPYSDDPSPADVVEQRFQQLLKEDGIE
jgi:penicillin-binding protein 1A